MGYRDIKLALCTSQQVTVAAISENYIDTELVIPGWEKGVPAAIILTTETINTAGTGFSIQVIHKLTAPGTGDATLYTIVLTAAQLAVGKQIVLPLVQGVPMLKMVGLYFTRTGGTEDYVFSAYFTSLPTAI